MIKKENKPVKKRFRISSKTFFLTYPQVPSWATEFMFLDCFKQMFPKREHELMKYLITKEYHEDGNPHFHVLLEFPFVNHINSRDKLHVTLIDPVTGENVVLEGKYESSRKMYSVIKYMLKDQQEEPFTNLRLLTYKGVVHDDVESYLLYKARYEGVEIAIREMLDYFPELMKHIVRLKNAFKAIRETERNKERYDLLNSRIKPIDSFVNVPQKIIE